MSFWNMLYGDALKDAINKENTSVAQKLFFLDVYSRMGKFVRKNDEPLTFREYFEMYERRPPKK